MVLIDIIQTQMVLLHQIGRKLCRVVQCFLEVSVLIDADLNTDPLLISLRRSRMVPYLLIRGSDIALVASDDGLNAAGGTDSSGSGGRDGMFGGPGSSSSSNGTILISAVILLKTVWPPKRSEPSSAKFRCLKTTPTVTSQRLL